MPKLVGRLAADVFAWAIHDCPRIIAQGNQRGFPYFDPAGLNLKLALAEAQHHLDDLLTGADKVSAHLIDQVRVDPAEAGALGND
ncbi:hypothetical protein D3C86_1595810 [compost metagenome]